MALPLHTPIESTCVDPFDPRAFQPMLAQRARSVADIPDGWRVEHHWDGMRLLAGLGGGVLCLAGRGGRDFAPLFPELARLVDLVDATDWILDGEVVCLGEDERPDRATVTSRIRGARGATADMPPARMRFVAFDMIAANGEDLRSQPWRERRERLERHTRPEDPLFVAQPEPIDPADALRMATEAGLEGIVARTPDAPYRSGMRPPNTWLELAARRRGTFRVTGMTPLSAAGAPDESRVGSLTLAARMPDGTLRDAGKVGSGMDGELRRRLADRLAGTNEPLVVDVEFSSWTSEGRLRHPTFLAIRDDVHPDNFTTETD
jgi:bifunctional non-homologous end joining protein LigD